MIAIAALYLSATVSGFAYFSGSGYLNARPSQNIWDRPTPLEGIGRIQGLSCGYDHGLALRMDGTVVSWGANGEGQLGRQATSAPAVIPGLPTIKKVVAAGGFSLALAADGKVYGWGANGAGQLGAGALKRQKTPVQVMGISDVADLAAGMGHVIALKTDGTLASWGANSYGTLGDGTTTSRNTPAPIPGLENIVRIDSDGLRSAAIRSDGTLFSWGYNYNDWLGVGSSATSVLSPTAVLNLTNVVDVSMGTAHTLALRSDGKVFSWGSNAEGQLGDPTLPLTFLGTNRPAEVPNLAQSVDVESAGYANAVVDSTGSMRLFGYTNYWLQPFKTSEPTLVPNLPPVRSVSVSSYNTLALVDTPLPFWVKLDPSSLVGGFGSTTLSVHTEEVQGQDVSFSLTSNNPNATIATTSLILPAGSPSASTTVKAPTLVNQPQYALVSAEADGISGASNLYIDIRRMNLYTTYELQAGQTGSGRIVTNFPAPKNGLVVTLASDDPSRLDVPSSVTIPQGATEVVFPVQTTPSLESKYVEYHAQQGSRKASNGVLIKGTWITGLTLDKSEVYGGLPVKVTVNLAQPAPPGGLLLELLPWPQDLQVGKTKRVPEGETSTVIRVGTYPVSAETGGALTVAAPNSYPQWVSFKVLPPYLKTAAFTPSTIQGGTNATLSITLNSVSAGDTLGLYSPSTAVQVPSGVAIPAGTKAMTFSIPTTAVTTNTNAWVRCRLRDTTIWTRLVLTP